MPMNSRYRQLHSHTAEISPALPSNPNNPIQQRVLLGFRRDDDEKKHLVVSWSWIFIPQIRSHSGWCSLVTTRAYHSKPPLRCPGAHLKYCWSAIPTHEGVGISSFGSINKFKDTICVCSGICSVRLCAISGRNNTLSCVPKQSTSSLHHHHAARSSTTKWTMHTNQTNGYSTTKSVTNSISTQTRPQVYALHAGATSHQACSPFAGGDAHATSTHGASSSAHGSTSSTQDTCLDGN